MTILLKIWIALFFSMLATVAYAENSRTWTPLGGDTGPAHSAGRKLASSPADDFALVDISSTISTDFKFSGAATASNGKIIFAPYNADGVGVFQAVTSGTLSPTPSLLIVLLTTFVCALFL